VRWRLRAGFVVVLSAFVKCDQRRNLPSKSFDPYMALGPDENFARIAAFGVALPQYPGQPER
jgi:hypothetical protein